MKRKASFRGILIALVLAAISGSVPALSPFEMEPRLLIDDKQVTIALQSQLNLSRVRLFWTIQDIPPKPEFDLFPRYRYFDYHKEPSKAHVFKLPFHRKDKKYYEVDLPFDKIIRFRLDAIAEVDDTNTFLHSKEYRFKVIKGKNEKPAFGLMFSDGPFIASAHDTSAMISWETNYPSKARVSFHRKGGRDKKMVEMNRSGRRGVLSLGNLYPDTRYYYRVTCVNPETDDEIASALYHFETAPKKGKDFRFAVMSDSRGDWRTPHPASSLNGVNARVLHRLTCNALEKDVDFIVFVGDLIMGNTDDVSSAYLQYKTWKEAVADVNAYIPIYPVMGNHDSNAPRHKAKPEKDHISAEEVWRNAFILPENGPEAKPGIPTFRENVYAFDYAGSLFTVLNSSHYSLEKPVTPMQKRYAGTIDEVQRDWLQLKLEDNKEAIFHFTFFHEPAYPTGRHYGNSLDRKPDVRDAVIDILDNYRVDALFCGHEHNYSRLYVNKRIKREMDHGLWQIITGGAGAPSYPLNKKIPWAKLVQAFSTDYHWVMVEVKGKKAAFTVYNDKGEKIEQFKIKRNKKD